ncbi:MAG TPA: MerR family transcriptional regulator [Pseudonocardiaceae bacterium]|nr:MerR family transcriptional regulator [Pseudonocardiaceae bacterium]
MGTETLQSIGAFARAVGLAPSALRYYDEAGLLSPAEVNARTGYRYYTPDQEHRPLVIRRLREASASVKTMRAVLDGTSEKAAAALREISDQANDSAQRTAAAVADVWSVLASTPGTVRPVTVAVAAPELAVAL